ncbi:hypothetical protein [Pelosinus sp. IPA-1]|uniref:hypothetical protein n=1 Tax=Pelosinus sp. IPA-1 TaxID=3029569 RepID=UPI002556116A|nr:hypothetical protein [Pelosinus sp. IPA-1]
MAWQLHSREENNFGEKFAEQKHLLPEVVNNNVDVATERLGILQFAKGFCE